MRKLRVIKEARDPQLAVLLLDFILGYNASMDPVGEVLEALIDAKKQAEARKGYLSIVASICGTQDDPQDLGLQTRLLQEAGIVVFNSNARAARFCAVLIKS
jgi:FdrA protein